MSVKLLRRSSGCGLLWSRAAAPGCFRRSVPNSVAVSELRERKQCGAGKRLVHCVLVSFQFLACRWVGTHTNHKWSRKARLSFVSGFGV